jgi:hypothetical protein
VLTSRNRRFVTACIAAVVLLTTSLRAARPDYVLFTDPGRRFSVEFPKDWKWTIVAGSGEALVLFTHPKNDAAVVVERYRMRQPLSREEVNDFFAQVEGDVLKQSQPRAIDVMAKVVNQNGGKRLILIDYARPAINGRDRERVRQYSFPVGQDLYRITCMALTNQFPRHETTFTNIADSLKSAQELGPAPLSESR